MSLDCFSCNRDVIAAINVVLTTSEYYKFLDLLINFNLAPL